VRIFYIPDGHRRYAEKTGCSLLEAYRLGYTVLVAEIVEPLFARPDVSSLDVFLLSNLNLERRDRHDLDLLRQEGEPWLWELIEHCREIASVRTVGSYLERNIELPSKSRQQLTLVIGCKTGDDVGCGEVDVFLRSGGELRLSGAPRTIIGDYTQFYAIDALHPELRFADVEDCLERYQSRYMREVQPI
jgi:undecaprenyl pyrophosphate synthase